MVKNFYIFRHGQSSHNLEGKILGHANNSVLTNKGVDESYNAGYILKDKQIDVIISSPLRRAKQSSAIVAKVTKAPVRFDDCLVEADVGKLEGLHYKKVKDSFLDVYAKWLSDDNMDAGFEAGENKKQVRERMVKTLNKYVNSPYKNVVISGHNLAAAQALRALKIDTPEIPNGAIVHLQYDKGSWHYIDMLVQKEI